MRRRSGVVSHSVGGVSNIRRRVLQVSWGSSRLIGCLVRLEGLRDSWDAICCALESRGEGSGCWVAPWVASWAETGGKGFFQRFSSSRFFSFSITLAASSVIIGY